jgi:hypothetical protein
VSSDLANTVATAPVTVSSLRRILSYLRWIVQSTQKKTRSRHRLRQKSKKNPLTGSGMGYLLLLVYRTVYQVEAFSAFFLSHRHLVTTGGPPDCPLSPHRSKKENDCNIEKYWGNFLGAGNRTHFWLRQPVASGGYFYPLYNLLTRSRRA